MTKTPFWQVQVLLSAPIFTLKTGIPALVMQKAPESGQESMRLLLISTGNISNDAFFHLPAMNLAALVAALAGHVCIEWSAVAIDIQARIAVEKCCALRIGKPRYSRWRDGRVV